MKIKLNEQDKLFFKVVARARKRYPLQQDYSKFRNYVDHELAKHKTDLKIRKR